MAKNSKADYPKRISGTLNISADQQLNIPELELCFTLDVDSKGNRKVVSCGGRIPGRFTETDIKPIYFENSKCIVYYNQKDEIYSITITSIDPFLDSETKMPIAESEVEKYCRLTEDIDLMVLINICQFMWTSLMDNLDTIDISGKFIKAVIKTFNEAIGDSDMEKLD
jgi:hypothetical protein